MSPVSTVGMADSIHICQALPLEYVCLSLLLILQLADELEALYHNYTARTFAMGGVDSRNNYYRSRSTSGGSKSASFFKSGSIDLTSSQESTSSEQFQRTPTKDNFLEASQTSETSVQTVIMPGSMGGATYINVELKQRRTAESSGSEIDEEILKPPNERMREEISPPVVVASTTIKEPSPSPPPQLPLQSSDNNEAVVGTAANDDFMPTPFDDPLPDLDTTLTFTEHEIFGIYDQTTALGSLGSAAPAEDDTQEEHDTEKATLPPPPAHSYHNYANLDFIQVNNLLSQASTCKSATEEESSSSPKGPKKPMPIQRKTKGSTPQSGSEEGTTKSTIQESPVRNPKKPAPPVKPSYLKNQDSESSLNLPKVQQQQTPTPSSSSSTTTSSSVSKPHPTIPALNKFLSSAAIAGGGGEERARDDLEVSTGSTGSGVVLPSASSKPRSHTTAELHSTTVTSMTSPSSAGEKKHPILPPATRYRSKSRSPSPVVSPADTTPPKNQQEPQTQPTATQVAPKEKKIEEESGTKESNKIVLGPVPALAKKPVLKAQVSEPGTGIRNRRPIHIVTSTAVAPALNRANKPAYGSKFPRPVGGGGGGGERANHTSSSNSNNEQDELMKKLTLRRLKIDEQLGTVTKPSNAAPSSTTVTKSNNQKHSPPSLSPQIPHRTSAPLGLKSAATVSGSSIRSGDPSSERNSTISTSSSEVIVAYRKLDESPSLTSLSSNGTSYSMDGSGSGGPLLRKPDESNYGNEAKEMNLAKYGIIEEGGSYVI